MVKIEARRKQTGMPGPADRVGDAYAHIGREVVKRHDIPNLRRQRAAEKRLQGNMHHQTITNI